jgi:hypothetical protein
VSLDRRRELAGKQVCRDDINGGPVGRCARAGKGGLPFIGSQRVREVCVCGALVQERGD